MSTLEDVIITCLMTPRHDPFKPECIWGLPLNIIGLSGCGKSERVVHACRSINLTHQVVFPASKQPEDFGGAPFATEDGIVIECILPQANVLINKGAGVLFIDELSTARPAVQASALGLVNDRRVGDHILPPKVRVLCAMNPAEYAAGGFILEAPLANRMMHISYDPPTAEEWVDWLTDANPRTFQTATDAEARVQQGWHTHWSQLRGLLAGFVQANRTKLHMQPKPDDPNAGGPWPSHRMWHWAGRAIAAARCLNMPKDVENTVIQGCVGEGILQEWAEWIAKADLPSPEDMLTKAWMPDRNRLDVTLAAITSMTAWVTEIRDKAIQAQFTTLAWQLVQRVIDNSIPDIAVWPAKTFVARGLANTHPDAAVREASKQVILWLGKNGYTQFQDVVQ